MVRNYIITFRNKANILRGRGTSFFPVRYEKLPPSYIQDAKNFPVVKPLNSGEARASPASPVPQPLSIAAYRRAPYKSHFSPEF